MMVKNSDRLWKTGNLFEILKKKFSKFYSPSKHVAVNEVIVKYKGRVIFRQNIPKTQQRLTDVGTRCADHVTPLYPQKLTLTSPTGGGRSVGIVRVRTKATERDIPKTHRRFGIKIYKLFNENGYSYDITV